MTTLTVVGGGPAGLTCALVAARRGPVRLIGRPPPAAPSVESVPAALLTLLIEFGITPSEVDVDRLVRERELTWQSAVPERLGQRAVAHLDRGSLVAALWRRVLGCSSIAIEDRLRARPVASGVLVDATGRRAVGARGTARPGTPWVASYLTVPRGVLDPTLQLAADEVGYGIRLGSASWLTVGWVGPGSPPRDGAGLTDRLTHSAGERLLAGLDLPTGQRTTRRVASVALPATRPPWTAVGDAATSRDALASQGISIGISQAYSVGERRNPIAPDIDDDRLQHSRSLGSILAACRFADEPVWSEYSAWLAATAARAPARAAGWFPDDDKDAA